MAGIKISNLPAVPSAALTDIFPVVQGGITSQESLTQVLALFQGKITSLGAQTAALNMNTHLINNVVNPVSPQDAATKNYVDTLVTGGGAAVVAATTGALTVTQAGAGVGATLTNAGAQAAFQIDGISPTVGQRVLIKNQAATSQNGAYTVTNVGSGATNWVLTRATDYDTPADINATGVIPVVSGTVNANTGWINTTVMVTVDTTAVTFVQFGASFPISLANGGTGASLTAANGAIPYSTASAMAFLAPGTTGQLFKSGGAGAPVWVTPTGTGVPVLNSSPNIIGGLLDTNGNSMLGWLPIASAVNAVQISNAATLGNPSLTAAGSDTNISLVLTGKGTGGVQVHGTGTNDSASAGYVGEYISSQILNGSAISLTNNTPANVTSISLTAGDWNVGGNIYFFDSVTGYQTVYAWISTISATQPDLSLMSQYNQGAGLGFQTIGINTPIVRLNLATTTTVYLSCQANVGSGATASGGIWARRVR